ncbi:MAG: TonB-dependent receptor domain-containing protein, partial [bacterium]
LWGTGQSLLWHRFVARGMGYRSWSRQLRVVDLYGKDHQTNDRVGGRLELSFATPGRHLVTVGGQVDREWGWYDLVSREVVSASEEGGIVTNPLYQGSGTVDRTRFAVFAQDEWSPVERLGLNLGVRASRGPFTYGTRLDPRLSAALQVGGDVTLRGAWGVYEQDPVIELDGTGTHEITGGRTAQSRHMMLGVEKRFGGVRLGVDAYDKELWKLDGVVTRTVEGEIERQAITRGRARGVEVFLHRSSAASSWWVAYSLGRSAWGNQRRTYMRDFDRLHTFSVTNTFQIAEDWDLGMSWSVHSGTPYTEQRWERDPETGKWALSEGVPNAARLPLYQRLDVRVRRHFRFDRWQMSVYAEGLNLTNHDNVIWYSWGFREVDGSRQPHQIPRTGLPSIPSVGLEIKF